ncbi:hypothetical protein PMI26_00526 [Pseudomonas sp. GM33]|nr:hypothetical protein PMI26_00526 [Pseudomonas sp. GM33]
MRRIIRGKGALVMLDMPQLGPLRGAAVWGYAVRYGGFKKLPSRYGIGVYRTA